MSSVLTVSQINTYLKAVLDGDDNLQNIFVVGEISNFTNHYRTGHFYFTLKDESAALKAVMFRSAAQRLRFLPENGMRVVIRGSISLFPRDGVYQLYCEDMQPDGAGALSVAFEQLKQKLGEMGLFDDSHKKPIPACPARIGVVTSPTGAAIHDILTVLERRFPLAEVILCGVQVQGEAAAGQIAQAIERFNALKAADVLIVGRGGGSIEDLWAFNDERVARTIYASRIPVISAVGHEPDVTISDYVADRRASTPSNAAEISVPDVRAVQDELLNLEHKLFTPVSSMLFGYRRQLDGYYHKRVLREPDAYVELRSLELDRMKERFLAAQQRNLLQKRGALLQEASALEAMSPLKVLSRGYLIGTSEDGSVLRSVRQVHTGQSINLRFSDGNAECRIKHLEEDSYVR